MRNWLVAIGAVASVCIIDALLILGCIYAPIWTVSALGAMFLAPFVVVVKMGLDVVAFKGRLHG